MKKKFFDINELLKDTQCSVLPQDKMEILKYLHDYVKDRFYFHDNLHVMGISVDPKFYKYFFKSYDGIYMFEVTYYKDDGLVRIEEFEHCHACNARGYYKADFVIENEFKEAEDD